ncbi:MAG: aspartate dehydrogenase [Clostridiales bacterium]|nr:aspartate dehydrogenase [Clostridiales bacterium]
MWFRRKRPQSLAYDPARQRPVIRASICTGEQTACLRDRETGKLEEVMLLRTPEDRQSFCRACGVGEDEVEIIY